MDITGNCIDSQRGKERGAKERLLWQCSHVSPAKESVFESENEREKIKRGREKIVVNIMPAIRVIEQAVRLMVIHVQCRHA